MVIITGTNLRPGTKSYKKALQIVAEINVDLNDVAIVDSLVPNFSEFVFCAKNSSGFKVIAIEKSVANKFKKENIPVYQINKLSKKEALLCQKWVRQKNNTSHSLKN